MWLDRFRAPPPPEIRDDPQRSRYEVRVDGRRAGYSEYRRQPDGIAIVETQIEPEFEGRGLGGALVREMLGRARAEGVSVFPTCPFAREYIERHPSQLDLVPAERRAEFGLPADG